MSGFFPCHVYSTRTDLSSRDVRRLFQARTYVPLRLWRSRYTLSINTAYGARNLSTEPGPSPLRLGRSSPGGPLPAPAGPAVAAPSAGIAGVVPLQNGGGGALPVPGAARPPPWGSAGSLRLRAGPRRGAGDALRLPDRDGSGEEGEK